MTKPALEPGYAVALTLTPDAAPLRVYVGQVQTVDEHGVRLTLVDWLIGSFSGWDVFVPWSQITSALVATPDHDVPRFGDAAGDWQRRMTEAATPPTTTEAAQPPEGA